GMLTKVLVHPGERVSRGDLLLLLTDPEKEQRFLEIQTQHRTQEIEVKKLQALHDSRRLAVAREQLLSLELQLADFRQELEELKVTAPCDGTVVSIARVAEPKTIAAELNLHGWHGTPLDEENLGCLLEPRTEVLALAP